jgi:predicted dehydrogenase
MDNEKRAVEVLLIGAGTRGTYIYGELTKREDIKIKIVGVAEPIEDRREKMKKEHGIPSEYCFKSGEEALKHKRFCDAVINITPDRVHHKIAVAALEKGYHLLLEKPMATSAKDCVDILEAQRKSKKVLMVAHVLRYSPFFQKMKKIVDSKELGKMLSLDILEEIGYWHFAHSYVRGNWRKKKEAGPIILTKSSHDMDLISWFVNGEIKSVRSSGSLKYFRKGNSQKGSTVKCIGKCKVKKACPYNAEKFYLNTKDPDEVVWPTTAISPVDKSIAARKKVLKEGPYGTCVWKCDNDVCDNQEVIIRFKKNIIARFTLTAFGSEPTRKVRIYLEKGELHGDLSKGSIRIVRYSGVRGNDEINGIELPIKDHHGGGDELLLKAFVKTVKEKNKEANLTTAQNSIRSHLLSFAAEDSRMQGKPINFQTYKKKLGL